MMDAAYLISVNVFICGKLKFNYVLILFKELRNNAINSLFNQGSLNTKTSNRQVVAQSNICKLDRNKERKLRNKCN